MRTNSFRFALAAALIILAGGCRSGQISATETPEAEVGSALAAGSLSDIDGNTYPALQFGDQIWMGSNLLVTQGPDGSPVESFCYEDQEENCQEYGRLYTMAAALGDEQGEGVQGICPDGWHVPSMSEWKTLIDYLGGQDTAGRALKDPNGMGLLPSGWFDFTGEYRGLGGAYFLRTSSAPNASYANIWMLESGSDAAERGDLHPDDAIPLRCVRDY